MMRITVDGLIYQGQPYGGISKYYTQLLPELVNADPVLQIFLLTRGDLVQSPPVHPSITHFSIPNILNLFRPRRIFQGVAAAIEGGVVRHLVAADKDCIWISTHYSVLAGWPGRSVVVLHDLIWERFATSMSRPEDYALREKKARCLAIADAVICVSESTKNELENFYKIDARKVYVVHHGCDSTFGVLSDRSCTKRLPEPFVMYIGHRLYHYKNFGGLLTAYKNWGRSEDVKLLVVGNPWTKEEQEKLAELQIADRVCLLTRVSDKELCKLYNESLALVYPSLAEGFGLPLLEAMACGCPIVASRIPSTREVAGDCPVYFDLESTESLIQALDQVVAEGRFGARVAMGLNRVRGYSWARTAEQTLSVLRGLA